METVKKFNLRVPAVHPGRVTLWLLKPQKDWVPRGMEPFKAADSMNLLGQREDERREEEEEGGEYAFCVNYANYAKASDAQPNPPVGRARRAVTEMWCHLSNYHSILFKMAQWNDWEI